MSNLWSIQQRGGRGKRMRRRSSYTEHIQTQTQSHADTDMNTHIMSYGISTKNVCANIGYISLRLSSCHLKPPLVLLPVALTSIVVIEFRCMRFAIFPSGFGLLFIFFSPIAFLTAKAAPKCARS